MTDKQILIIKELQEKEDKLDFTGWYSANCYVTGLDDLDENTSENAVSFILHRDNTYDCEGSCGERTEYYDGEEYTYSICGDEGECPCVWEEYVYISSDGLIHYNDEMFKTVNDFLEAV